MPSRACHSRIVQRYLTSSSSKRVCVDCGSDASLSDSARPCCLQHRTVVAPRTKFPVCAAKGRNAVGDASAAMGKTMMSLPTTCTIRHTQVASKDYTCCHMEWLWCMVYITGFEWFL